MNISNYFEGDLIYAQILHVNENDPVLYLTWQEQVFPNVFKDEATGVNAFLRVRNRLDRSKKSLTFILTMILGYHTIRGLKFLSLLRIYMNPLVYNFYSFLLQVSFPFVR